MQTIRSIAASTAAIVIILIPISARADGGWGNVDCDLSPRDPQCTIEVVDPGHGGTDGGSSGGGPLICRIGGAVVPCYEPGFGWLGSGGCYYGKDDGGFLPAHEYLKNCRNPDTDEFTFGGTVFLADYPASLAAMIQQALSRLTIPAPKIASNPGLDKPHVVYVPVWWWIQPGLWRTHTASASLPGITITAYAEPTKVVWRAGDGTSTTCRGPGTPWTSAAAPTAASPTCGHTYTKTSRTSPRHKFAVTAAVTWTITWSGGGLNGTEPPATTTDSATVEVTELRSVITG